MSKLINNLISIGEKRVNLFFRDKFLLWDPEDILCDGASA